MRLTYITSDPRIKFHIAAIYALPLAAAVLLQSGLAHAGTIVEFTQPNCPHVAELAATVTALEKRGVAIEAHDVTEPANLAQAKRLGVPGTPAVVIDGQMYAGDQAVMMLKMILSFVGSVTAN